jgi:N-sulfoglucosamine sulfohydrolase
MNSMNLSSIKAVGAAVLMLAATGFAKDNRPNIIFAIADDWGWPHAGAYGNDEVVQTPTFDRLAKEGILFEQAYISSPSCTPSRNAILTGQYHWRLGWGGNLWSMLDTKHRTYPHLLEEAGYFTGHWRKSWGPGKLDNWDKHPAGNQSGDFAKFLAARPPDKPFCFWLGASDPHRPYKPGTGKARGMDLGKIKLFEHYPDSESIRSDVADYYFEVERFDGDVGRALELLEKEGLSENTIIVMTGDHGMPFPRCKSNLYDSGARVPMAVRWPQVIKPGRVVTDFVSTTDLAPTFLNAAGVDIPKAMTGRSWMPIFNSSASGRIEKRRSYVLTGKERHVAAQEAPDGGGTPMRAIRNDDFLLIRNYRTDRWPSGTPNWKQAFIPGSWLGDCDNGPAKTYMVNNREKDAEHRRKYELAFGKRPEFELYDLKKDPGQINNVADRPGYAPIVKRLNRQMTADLKATGDPRALGRGQEVFDNTKYLGGGPLHPDAPKKKRKPRAKKK